MHPETLLTNPNPSVPRTKSILSRFSNPLSKRNTKVFDFDIEPEHPHKTYKPGDKVRGHISLSVFKGFDITHLVVALHGYARVFKHQRAPGEIKDIPESLINGKGQHGFEYHGNGLASLFQDEQVLCGSGFLRKQVYKFGFELHFPSQSLPGTIEFERGDVNYLITATVTRPTAIAPTTNRIYKVKFENTIDIESMYTPKSRAIYLEPMIRRGKVKRVRQASSAGTDETATARTLSRQSTMTGPQNRPPNPLPNPPLSPAPSQSTFESNASESTHSLSLVEHDLSRREGSPNQSEPRSSTTSNSAHTISAVTEILQHGALPGESVSIRVKVEHSKAVRGVIIATLYRQSRIDMHPPLPIATRSKKKKPEYEDVYPKSRTGLGGLYFTNGTPNMAFRKDLSQAFSMMIVDPTTKTADVRFSIKIPDKAFPTMDNIPGGMISFTYFIEVVVDLTGKLGEARFLPSLTTTGPSFTQADEVGNHLTSEWANNILDTAPLRRTKNVASFELPLIIGTEDGSKRKTFPKSSSEPQNAKPNEWSVNSSTYYSSGYEQPGDGYHSGYDYSRGHNDYESDGNGWYDENGRPLYDEWYDPRQQQHYLQNQGRFNVPPPHEEEHVDEKARLRRHEELLLPSAPPESEASSSSAQYLVPSAPIINEDTSNVLHGPRQTIPIIASRASARSADTIVLEPPTPPPSLPDNEIINPLEDKQELERQRLLAQASAPPTEDEDNNTGPSNPRRHNNQTPSAPVVNQEEEYLSEILPTGTNEALPRYHR